jgi:hypothetical protein
MPEDYKQLQQTVLTAGANPVAVSPVGAGTPGNFGEGTIIKHMRFVNKAAAPNDTTLKLWHTANGDTAPATPSSETQQVIVPAVQIDAGGWAEFEGAGILLMPGDQLYGSAGAGADITVTVYGLELTP